MKPILHITSKKLTNKSLDLIGSSKDIYSRIEYFNKRNILVDRISTNINLKDLYSNLKYVNKNNYSEILIEHSPSIFVQIYLYIKFGKIIYRSHNAEFYHRLHIFIYNLKHFFNGILLNNKKIGPRNLVLILYRTFIVYFLNIFRFLARDFLTSILSKKIFSNCEWEKKNYWDYFAKSKTLNATPFLSGKYLNKMNSEEDLMKIKKNIIIISGSIYPNPISYEQIASVVELKKLKQSDIFQKFYFVVTGKVSDGILKLLVKQKINELNNFYFYNDKNMYFKNKELRNFETNLNASLMKNFKILGNEDYLTYYDLLKKSKAMLFLTKAGFGFKNKSLEAYAAKNSLIMPKSLAERFPSELKQIVYSYDKINNLLDILIEIDKKINFISDDLNDHIRKSSFKSYDKVFLNNENI